MKLQRVHLDEVHELEPLVIADLSGIEEGLQSLDNQFAIGEYGRPDIIAVDGNRSLVIIELKSGVADCGALAQALRYYDWFASNTALAARPFPRVDPRKPVRVFIVASGFTEDLLRLYAYIDIDVTLVHVVSVRDMTSGDTGLLYESVEPERSDESTLKLRSVDDIVGYICDSAVHDEFMEVLNFLKEQGVEISPFKGGKNRMLECKCSGDDIGYLQTKQKFFKCKYWDEEQEDYIWHSVRLTSFAEWKESCYPNIEVWLKDGEEDNEGS